MNKYKYSILVLLVSLLVTSCSTTKYVPDGSYLLSKVTIRVDSLSTYISLSSLMPVSLVSSSGHWPCTA